tara:strand:- start:7871 stop:8725 length:855 start_codon:yes stop_codon:yes gene_type:complete
MIIKYIEDKNFKKIRSFIKKFNLNSFNKKNQVIKYANFFNLLNLLKKIPEDNKKDKNKKHLINVVKDYKKPHVYELDDLCRLHWIVLNRKPFNILEIGSGFSTVFMAHACEILSKNFKKIENIRVEKKFHLYSLDESNKYLNITKKRIPNDLKKFVNLKLSKNKIIEYEGKYATRCSNIPNIAPDMIYLDGPSQYATQKSLNGFNLNNISRFPMSADILYLEYFLEPGTFIIVDGRTANARFLKDHFKRNWKYFHDIKGDCHYFELDEKPLGIYNKEKIEFKNK